ncbi:c-type cytochrome [Sulfuriflexus mobilis]|uniref:c-type cytochrome n=1 Tax=Sulfuriflexus mobilis TaxID=1811807 RepID=UPI000F83E16E|nr:c-type cytochrome [Sulfuriflexus mobilis]
MKNKLLGYCLVSILSTSASSSALAGGDPINGKVKADSCIGCHGANGISDNPLFPNLAGQKELYLIKQLKAFKNGSRIDPTMNAMVTALKDDDIHDLSAYFASLAPTSAHVKKSAANKAKVAKATSNEFPETVYISMKKSATVEEFPSENTWDGGPNMLYTAVTPDGKRVLSTSPSSNMLYVFDALTGKQIAIIPVGKAPKGVKVMPNGLFAYVSNQDSANISVVNLDSLSVVDTIQVEKGPHNARFTDDGKLAYVTLQGGAGIAVVDTASRKMIRVIPVPGITGPHNLDLSADEKTAYVRDFVHHVAVLNLDSGEVNKVIKVGNGHGGIDTAPNGRFVATAAIGDDFISVIDTNSLKVTNVKVGNGPHGIRASKDSQWIYVTVAKDNIVAVINTNTMTVEKNIEVGKFPFWVAVQGNP